MTDSGKKAKWDDLADRAMIDVLLEEKAAGKATSNGNYKDVSWTAVAEALEGSEERTGGAAKTADKCKGRYRALKADWSIVHGLVIKGSGWGWDKVKNMVTATPAIWEEYTKAHPKHAKWQNDSFPLYDDISMIVDGNIATGSSAFRPGQGGDDSDSEAEADSIEPTQALQLASPPPATPAPQPSASHSLARKRSAVEIEGHDDGGYTSSQRKKVSPGAQGMFKVASAVKDLSESFRSGSDFASPVRRQRAIQVIEDDALLSEDEEIKVFSLLRKETSVADGVLSISSAGKRARFVQHELAEALEASGKARGSAGPAL